MLELTVDKFGYLEIGSEEWLDDFSEVSETWTNVFNAYCLMRGDTYVSSDIVRDWAESLGHASGIYGEDDPVTVSTCNVDSFLSDDITYSFLYVTAIRTNDNGEDEEFTEPLIVVHGSGYMAGYAGECEVRTFNGDDDGDAFSYASGWANHNANRECGAEWILESASRMWPNGGQGPSPAISDCIRPSEDGEEHFLVCPECGDTLTPYIG